MNDLELSREVAKFNRENELKVKQMISDKMARFYGGDVEPIAEPIRMTYEEAKEQGNVREMINIKSGYYEKLDAERELEILLDNINIVEVQKELTVIVEECTKKKAVLSRTIENLKEILKDEYEKLIRENKAMGNLSGGFREIYLQDDYYKKLEHIEESEGIVKLRNELSAMQSRRGMLISAKDKYMVDNASLIAEERNRIKLEAIREAGIVE